MSNNEKSLKELLSVLDKEQEVLSYRIKAITTSGLLIGYIKSTEDDGEMLTLHKHKATIFEVPRGDSPLKIGAEVKKNKQQALRLIQEDCIANKKNCLKHIPFRKVQVKAEYLQ